MRWSKATFRSTNANVRSLKLDYSLAILVSPDYEVSQNKKLLDQMRPRLTIAVVHNADFAEMPALLNLSLTMELLTLSPHVAKSLAEATGRATDWMLPVYPVRPEPDCAASLSASDLEQPVGEPACLRGFAMQGKLLSGPHFRFLLPSEQHPHDMPSSLPEILFLPPVRSRQIQQPPAELYGDVVSNGVPPGCCQ